MVPCSIWIPPAASGPVLTVSRPMRTGLGCAIAGNGKDAVTAAPAAPARNPRRLTLTAISLLLFNRGSVALGQAEHVLREVVEHHLLRDRRDLVEPDLAPEPGAADPDRLDAGEDALGVERVEEMVEAAADLADDVRRRNLQPVDEDLVGVDGRAAELLDLAHGDLRAIERREEQRQPGKRRGWIARRRAGEQQRVRRMLGIGVPHLAAVHDEPVAVTLGARLNP